MASAKKKTSTGRIIVTCVLVLLAVFAALEFSVRYKFSHDISYVIARDVAQAPAVEPKKPKVSFGKNSLLLGVLQNKVKEVSIDMPSSIVIDYPAELNGVAQISGYPTAHALSTDIDITNINDPVTEYCIVDSVIPTELIKAEVQNQLTPRGSDTPLSSMLTLTDLIPNPDNQSFTALFGNSGARVELTPVLVDGALSVQITDATLFGMDIGKSIQDALDFAFQKTLSVADHFEFTRTEVTQEGLVVRFEGADFPLTQAGKSIIFTVN